MNDTRKYEEDIGQYLEKALDMAKNLEVKIIFGRLPNPYSDFAAGVYLSETRTIWISTDAYNIARPTKGLVHTIMHELVHAIQHMLGSYDFFRLPDDLKKIKANSIWKQTVIDEAPIFEVEADELATKICESWGMGIMKWHGGYAMKKQLKTEEEFLNYMWNEVYDLDVEFPEQTKEAA